MILDTGSQHVLKNKHMHYVNMCVLFFPVWIIETKGNTAPILKDKY